jgi:hypothetical protein
MLERKNGRVFRRDSKERAEKAKACHYYDR